MLLMNSMLLLLVLMLMMLKMMSMIDNDDGDDDVNDVDKDWAAGGDINEDGNFDVDEGYIVADVGSGEYFDSHDADDGDDYYGD
jgi:hypothetical protein